MEKKESNLLFTWFEMEGAERNFKHMSKKNRDRYSGLIMVAIIYGKAIKAKLGFASNIPDGTFLFNTRAIFEALTNDSAGYFAADPFPQLALLGTLCLQYQADIDNVRAKVMGAEGAKRATKKQMVAVLQLALYYVNQLAYTDQEHAEEIILSAKMVVIARQRNEKQNLSAKQKEATGVVYLRALAAKIGEKYITAVYEWEVSTDNGVTWVAQPVTSKANTVISGLTTGIRTMFRMRYSNSQIGTTAWFNPEWLIVE